MTDTTDPRVEAMAKAIYELRDADSPPGHKDGPWEQFPDSWQYKRRTREEAATALSAYLSHPLTIAEREVVDAAVDEWANRSSRDTTSGMAAVKKLFDACARLAKAREEVDTE